MSRLLLFLALAVAVGAQYCCLPSGECETLTQSPCEQAGGLYTGTGSCAGASCDTTVACCDAGGTSPCQDITEAACFAMGRTVTGANCQSAPCIGSCCVGDNCAIVTFAECGSPAVYNGHLTTCSNTCQNTPGACCYETGECIQVSSEGCFLADGEFQGRNAPCENSTCPLPPPDPTPVPPLEPQNTTPYIIGILVTVGLIFCCAIVFVICAMRSRKPRYSSLY